MENRDAYYDNAKFLLVFFVVFGHFIQSYIHEDQLIYTLYTTIYTFHMPAFILISVFFAKGFHKKGYLKKIAKN
jgi:fucose 4-O-acetylase-like acetyltransferase